jgi:DNA-binding NarL/FixJ family response regulator
MYSQYNPLKIAIADDHALFAKGIANLLETVKGFSVISVSSNGQELLNSIQHTGLPDVILLDIDMPVLDGFGAMDELTRFYGPVKVIALSMYKDFGYISKMILAGVSGYLLKNVQPEALIDAVQSVADGGLAFNQEAVSVMQNMVFEEQKSTPSRKDFSIREIEIIELICREMSASEIADKLFLSKNTVENYKKALFTKMNVTSTVGIAVFAIRNRII